VFGAPQQSMYGGSGMDVDVEDVEVEEVEGAEAEEKGDYRRIIIKPRPLVEEKKVEKKQDKKALQPDAALPLEWLEKVSIRIKKVSSFEEVVKFDPTSQTSPTCPFIFHSLTAREHPEAPLDTHLRARLLLRCGTPRPHRQGQ
jgi:hypothetical protein